MRRRALSLLPRASFPFSTASSCGPQRRCGRPAPDRRRSLPARRAQPSSVSARPARFPFASERRLQTWSRRCAATSRPGRAARLLIGSLPLPCQGWGRGFESLRPLQIKSRLFRISARVSKYSFEPVQCGPPSLGADMRRREFIALIGGVAAAWPLAARAQYQSSKVARIGVLLAGSPRSFSLLTKAFQDGLLDLGYVEGKTISIEWRWGQDRVERLPELATELVGLQVDVLVTGGTPSAKALKNATSPIPIIMAIIGDPVAAGIVDSLARPGGNATGFSILAPDLSGKRLQLLKEIIPTKIPGDAPHACERRESPWRYRGHRPAVSGWFTMATNDPNSAGYKRHDGRTSDSGCARPNHRSRRGSPVG